MSQALRILYVDDDEDVRRIASLALRLDPSLTVIDTASAVQALALIDRSETPFDLFIFDVMMPGMGGLELMAAIRERDDAVAHIPVVLMTARAQATDIAGYRAAGALGVIVKPFDPMLLAADVRAIANSA